RRRHVRRRFCRDALQRKIRLQHARERRRVVKTDFGAGEWMRAGLEDDALVSANRPVAWVVLDLDEADFYLLLLRRCVLRGGGGEWQQQKRNQCEEWPQPVPLPLVGRD